MTVLETVEFSFRDQLASYFHPRHPLQEKAWSRLWEMGIPHPQNEEYRSLRLRDLYALPFQKVPTPSVTREKILLQVPPECHQSCLVFVNGAFREDLSALSALPKGVLALPFSSALRSFGHFLTPYMTKRMKEEGDPFSLLNAALADEGAFLYVPPKVTVEAPICIFHWIENPIGPSLFSPRFHIFAGKESSLNTIFVQKSKGSFPYWINGVLDVTLEEKAHFENSSLVNEEKDRWHFLSVRSTLRKESTFKNVSVANGALSFRQDYRLTLAGEGAEASLYGAWMLYHNRNAYVNVIMDHQEPGCRSLQKFKNVLNGTSRSTFQGKIVVAPSALKTEAYQMNKTLLLSEKAIAITRPMLEILADDVKASHGATVGQLNEEELFYLKSRGLSEDEARHLLLMGFCKDIIDLLPSSSLIKEAMTLSKLSLS